MTLQPDQVDNRASGTAEFDEANYFVTVTAHPQDLREEWMALERQGHATPYQSYDWISTWVEAVGNPNGEDFRAIAFHSADGAVQAIVPAVIERKFGAKIARWAGYQFINYGLPAMSSEFAARIAAEPDAFSHGLAEALPDVDALHMCKQPDAWRETANPLGPLFTDEGANSTFYMCLQPDYDALYKSKRSSSTRAKSRRRESKLGKFGEISFGLPANEDEGQIVLDTLFDFAKTHLADRGVSDPYGQTGRTFYSALQRLPEASELQLKPYVLRTGSEIVAINMGVTYKGWFCGLVCAFTDGVQKSQSPGDLSLRKTIEACCQDQLEYFDFSAGRSDYKNHWAENTIHLYETVQPLTAIGYGYAAIVRPQLSTKRIVKNSSWLWNAAQRARKLGKTATLGRPA